MTTYRTFTRSALSFEDFSSAEKVEVETGLSIAEARMRCREFNNSRSEDEIAAGTKMEFEEE